MFPRLLLRGLAALALLLGGLTACASPSAPAGWTEHQASAVDDTVVPYLLRLPTDPAQPVPVLIFLHGAPGGVGIDGLHRLALPARWDPFLAAGWAVCISDYRGHPPNQPFAALRGEVNATDDVAAVFTALENNPALAAHRIAVMGNSLGGATTLQAVSEGKIAPRCLVLNAPASFRFVGLRGRPTRGAPLTDADIDRDGALRRIAPIDAPILIVQGTADGLSAINQKLFELLQSAGKDAQLALYPDAGHSFTNGPDTPAFRDAVTRSLDFVQTHTPPD